MAEDVQLFTTTLALIYCYKCGMPFGLSQDYKDRRIADKATWCCPEGHEQHFTGESAAEKLSKAQAETERVRAQRDEERAEKWRQERLKEAALRKARKLRNRAQCGVCPECNRSFAALKRHMETKHPKGGAS